MRIPCAHHHFLARSLCKRPGPTLGDSSCAFVRIRGLNAACRIECNLGILMPSMRMRAQYGHVHAQCMRMVTKGCTTGILMPSMRMRAQYGHVHALCMRMVTKWVAHTMRIPSLRVECTQFHLRCCSCRYSTVHTPLGAKTFVEDFHLRRKDLRQKP